MATNRTRKPRSRTKPALSRDEIAWLNSEKESISFDTLWLWSSGNYDDQKIFWLQHAEPILKAWVKQNPCTRPERWWTFNAPRWISEEHIVPYMEGHYAAPRKRLGGIGTPDYEVLHFCPAFTLGVPSGWVSRFDEEYYNGRIRDINGSIIPTKFKDGDFAGKGIDPANPPLFESQAAYLSRFDLLTTGEKRFLKDHPERMEPETIFEIFAA